MLDISRDIQSLSNFKRNTSSAIAQMKQTGEPIVLTVNGKAFSSLYFFDFLNLRVMMPEGDLIQ